MPANTRCHGRYRLRVFPACVLALIFSVTAAAAATSLESSEDRPAARPQTCLWSIDSGGSRVYLLGAVHFLRHSDYPLPDPMEAAYRRSRKIFFETDIDGMTDPALQARMMQMGTYPEGADVFERLRPDTRKLLEQKIGELGIPPAAIARLRPWTLAVTLAALELKRLGFEEDAGVDLHFYRKAKADGKAIGFLESNLFQVELLAGLDAAVQDAYLQQTLKDFEELEGLAPEMVALWRSGHQRRLHALMITNFAEHPDLRERFLARRNRSWAAQISDLVGRQEDILVVVGALHLVGPDSVVDLLERQGHRIRQH